MATKRRVNPVVAKKFQQERTRKVLSNEERERELDAEMEEHLKEREIEVEELTGDAIDDIYADEEDYRGHYEGEF